MGHKRDHEPWVSHLGGEGGVSAAFNTRNRNQNSQHTIGLIPPQFMLYVDCRLCLYHKAD